MTKTTEESLCSSLAEARAKQQAAATATMHFEFGMGCGLGGWSEGQLPVWVKPETYRAYVDGFRKGQELLALGYDAAIAYGQKIANK